MIPNLQRTCLKTRYSSISVVVSLSLLYKHTRKYKSVYSLHIVLKQLMVKAPLQRINPDSELESMMEVISADIVFRLLLNRVANMGQTHATYSLTDVPYCEH